MIALDIPGYGQLALEHLVLDFNGTLACDGQLLTGVAERLRALEGELLIHVLTADTFGSARAQLEGLPCELSVLAQGAQDRAKQAMVEQLGPRACVAVGNGRNDRLMLERAALGIAVVLVEGVSAQTLTAADVVCTDICAALDLLRMPQRLVATLRS